MPRYNKDFKFDKDDQTIVVRYRETFNQEEEIGDPESVSKKLRSYKGTYLTLSDFGYTILLIGTDDKLSKIKGKSIFPIPTGMSREDLSIYIQESLGGDKYLPTMTAREYKFRGEWTEDDVEAFDVIGTVTSITTAGKLQFSEVSNIKSDINELETVFSPVEHPDLYKHYRKEYGTGVKTTYVWVIDKKTNEGKYVSKSYSERLSPKNWEITDYLKYGVGSNAMYSPGAPRY